MNDDTSLALRALQVGLFPVLLGGGLAAHFALLEQTGVLPATFAPIVIAGLIICLCEGRLPANEAWRPGWREVMTDTLFMVAVQVLFAHAAAYALVTSLIGPLGEALPVLARIWPCAWAWPMQFLLFLLAADFTAYWLHRAAHGWPWLWALHSVHHSPTRLHALNVGRFHPLEKLLQILFITTPLVLLGAGEDIVTAWFVYYAIHGMLQHCNVKLTLGPLNYVFSGPELHRWHHSSAVREAAHNFGNNTIVWDLVFGTRLLPRDREVKRLGWQRGAAPTTFLQLLGVPFRQLGRLLAAGYNRWLTRMWRSRSQRPRSVQVQALRNILMCNRTTDYGRLFDFATIAQADEYRRRVPIVDYDALADAIVVQARTGGAVLTEAMPGCYARTSGTTGPAKFIPLTTPLLASLARQQRHQFACVAIREPAVLEGKTLALVGAEREGCLTSGQPYGAMAAILSRLLPAAARRRFVLPDDVFNIADARTRLRAISFHALACRDITNLVAANPDSLLQLSRAIVEDATVLAEALRAGRIDLSSHTTIRVHTCKPDPQRAEEVLRLARERRLTPALLWPEIRALNTWTSGSCGIFLERLRACLPENTRVFDLGYAASECRMTTLVPGDARSGLPVMTDVFFEFAPIDAWDRGDRETLLLDELILAQRYYTIVTTIGGLYRYFMNDIVQVSDFYGATPLLQFVRKGGNTTNIIGEKLTEDQVITAMRQVVDDGAAAIDAYVFAADAKQARYHAYVECRHVTDGRGLERRIDAALRAANVEYATKRRSERLSPVRVRILREGTIARDRARTVVPGQREMQFKPKILRGDPTDVTALLRQAVC